jgi:murein DD-endopeptidase MepM/ murein hydrolase activator NlpD
MRENKNPRGVFGKGYYIALILCAAAIGITSYVYSRNEGPEAPAQEASAPLEQYEADVAAIATQPKGSMPTEKPLEPQTPQPRTLKTTSPVAGQEVFGYSMEVLSYNQTTRDWRTHNGVDIAAEAGTEVVAAADGEVYTTYEDESLGYTVVIRHEGGYTTHYSSLGEDIRVQAGDQVLLGQVIGTVGESALVETVLGPHVHFSVTYQDAAMDPAEFLNME